MSVLVIAEHLRGETRDVTFELVTAARELDAPVKLVVIGADPSSLDLACEDVDEIVSVRVRQEEFESDVYRAGVEALIAEFQPEVVLAGFTVNAMSWAPAVAARLGLGFASDVFGLSRDAGVLSATRAFYGGKVHAQIAFPESRPVLLLLRPATWAAATRGGDVPTVEFALPAVTSRTRHIDFVETARDDVDITTADFILAIGRGVGERENVSLFERLAEKLGATLAVSRPLVDAGWAPNSRQVGQSGKTVKPKVYLAFGISGAVQHLAGMKSSGTIIAVNNDSEAAIFSVAHYGAVADLFDIAEELNQQL